MASPGDVALVEAYTRRYNRLRVATGAAVGRIWDQYAGLDDTSAERFTSSAASAVMAAQAATGAQVDGYLSTFIGTTALGINPAAITGAALRAGVDPVEVYHRSVVEARVAISEGKSYDEAMGSGRERAVLTAITDIALAQRATIAMDSRVVGYRRVLRGSSCALCGVASTQRYHRGDLMPIHGRCDCGVAPIIGSSDPGRVINRPLLDDLKKRGEVDRISKQRALPKAKKSLENARAHIEQVRAELRVETDQIRETRIEKRLDRWQQEAARREKRVADLTEARALPKIAVHEHGELGPVLTDASHAFTGLAA